MLKLSRRPGESITIFLDPEVIRKLSPEDRQVEITHLGFRGHKAVFGLRAPKQIPILRNEVISRDQSEEPLSPALEAAIDAAFGGGRDYDHDRERFSPHYGDYDPT